jgi:hypothetical protein
MQERDGKEEAKEQPAGSVFCYYDDNRYSPGSRLCQEKKVMICGSDGTWGKSPSDENC